MSSCTFVVVRILIAFENTISLSVDRIRLSAGLLIVSARTIRKLNNEHTLLLYLF